MSFFRRSGFCGLRPSPLVALALVSLCLGPLSGHAAAQTAAQPTAFPVPFASVLTGQTPPCSTAVPAFNGSNYGDGCPFSQAITTTPFQTFTDATGNVFFSDNGHASTRVLYNGSGTDAVGRAITLGSSGFNISATRPGPATIPVAGNTYTILGAVGGNLAAVAGKFYCANYAATSQPTARDYEGDNCPAQSVANGSGAFTLDQDGNLFQFSANFLRVLCINCVAGNSAYQLIQQVNGTSLVPNNGYVYFLGGGSAGYTNGSPAATSQFFNQGSIAADAFGDLFLGDAHGSDVRVLYNQPTVAAASAAPGSLAALIAAVNQKPSFTTINQGYIYLLAGSGPNGTPCTIAGGNNSGCNQILPTVAGGPATNAVLATQSQLQQNNLGVAVDYNGNVYFNDTGNHIARAIYGGIANPLTIPATQSLTLGFVYTIAGNGLTSGPVASGTAPLSLYLNRPQGLYIDAQNNLFITDTGNNRVFEIPAASPGAVIALGGGTAGLTTPPTFCNGGTAGPTSIDALGDGCPATQTILKAPSGAVSVDFAGNLLIADTGDSVIQRFSTGAFAPTAAGQTTAANASAFVFLTPQTLGATPFTVSGAFADAGGNTCLPLSVQAADTTCVVNTTFNPVLPGLNVGAVSLNASGTTAGSVGIAQEFLAGVGQGAAVAFDPGAPVTVGSGLKPAGVAVGAGGLRYVSDAATGNVLRFAGATQTTVASGFKSPAALAVDGAGNVYVADASAGTVTEILPAGKVTLATGLANPGGMALDARGDLYMADTGHNRIMVVAPGSSLAVPLAGSGLLAGLLAPRALAFDASGNLYIGDTGNARIVQIAPNGAQTVVANANPSAAALALDAAGNLYAADLLSDAIVEYPAATGYAPVTLLSGLIAPQQIALDLAGNLSLADSGTGQLQQLTRTTGAFTFQGNGMTIVSESSIGNQPLVPSGTPPYTQSNAVDFTVVPASTNGCSGTLPPGTTCNLQVTYAQKGAVPATDTVSFASNAANGKPSGFVLTGAAVVNRAATTTSLTATPSTARVGVPITFTATVAASAGGSPTGNVVFLFGTRAIAAGTLVNGVATAQSTVLPIGNDAISAAYMGDGAFAPSTSTVSVSVVIVPPPVKTTLTLTGTSTTSPGQTTVSGQPYTFTATVNLLSASPATPGGTVTFLSGATVLSTQPLVGNMAFFSTSTLATGSPIVTAVYSGDPNFIGSTSQTLGVTVYAPFSAVPDSSSLTIATYPGSATTNITIAPGAAQLNGTQFAVVCTGLPSGLSCAASTIGILALPINNNLAQIVPLTVVDVNGTVGQLRHGVGHHDSTGSLVSYAGLLGLPLTAGLLIVLRRKGLRRLRGALSFMLLLSYLTVLSGCGLGVTGGGISLDPVGTYPFTVTVYSGTASTSTTPGAPFVALGSFNMTVTQK